MHEPRFSVRFSPRFGRLARQLANQHPGEFPAAYAAALNVLEQDAANVSRRHPIRKLADARPGDGAWRLRLGRFRFRYDVAGRDVELVYCGMRREDTYR